MFAIKVCLTPVRRTWIICVLWAICLLPNHARAQKRIYLAPDDHTDFFWSAGESEYHQAFLDMLDYHLDRMDETEGAQSIHQARWNCDGHYWLWVYQNNRTSAEFDRLISRIADGHISVPLNALAIAPGSAPTEAILRGMYYPGKLQRQYGIDFPLAYAIENQTLSLGLISLWAGAGAEYTWKGICDCDTAVPDAVDRDHEIYWAQGIDGRRMLMKWNSMLVANDAIGGYAEAHDPYGIVDFVDTNAEFIARYPWDVIGAFGQGWDNLRTLNEDVRNAAISKTTADREVIVSNEADFFVDFENSFGAQIPTQTLAYGNEWDLYAAAIAEQTARVRRAAGKLRGAEAMAALALRVDPAFMDGRETARDLAWMNFGLFWEHNMGMVDAPTGSAGTTERINWQRRLAGEIESYVDALESDARQAVADAIANSGTAPRFCVFNSLGWSRSAVADLPYAPSGDFHVVDLATGVETPSQLLTLSGETRVRIRAADLPPLGYKAFEIRSGAGQTWSDAATFSGGDTLETSSAIVRVDGGGAIVSWIDKTRGYRQWVQTIDGRDANDFGGDSGAITLESMGPVSAALRIDSTSAPAHTTRITLFADSPRIHIENEILETFNTTETWDFGFNLSNPNVWHEELGAVLNAREEPEGHYASRASRLDWLTLNHFVDMTGAGPAGVTISSPDCAFFRLGASSPSFLDVDTPRISVLAGGRVANGSHGIPNQAGDSHFTQRFTLEPHDAYDQTEAMRMALESQNPPIAEAVPAGAGDLPQTRFSMLTVDDGDVLMWAFKPHEDDPANRVTARLWNHWNGEDDYQIQSDGLEILEAWRATHIETISAAETVAGGAVAAIAPPAGINTHVLRVALADAPTDPTPTPTPTPLPHDPRPYLQGGPPDHLVILETEGYHEHEPSDSHEWLEDNRIPGGSAGLGMAPGPNLGANNSGSGVEDITPCLDFRIEFNQTGTHYVWVRSHNQNSGTDDSMHIGLNGSIQPATQDMFTVLSNDWHWDGQDTVGLDRYVIDVPSSGIHTLNLFMREDGVIADKIVLTTNPGYAPDGAGPQTSPRSETPTPTPTATPSPTPTATPTATATPPPTPTATPSTTPTATPSPSPETDVRDWRKYVSVNPAFPDRLPHADVKKMRMWKADRLR